MAGLELPEAWKLFAPLVTIGLLDASFAFGLPRSSKSCLWIDGDLDLDRSSSEAALNELFKLENLEFQFFLAVSGVMSGGVSKDMVVDVEVVTWTGAADDGLSLIHI